MSYHFLLQGIFSTQGSNPCLLHWQADYLLLNHQGNTIHYILINDFIFLEKFKFHSKIKKKVKYLPYIPCPKCISPPIINIPHQTGAFVTTDEPTMTYHNHPKSIVYITIYSWCYTFYPFSSVAQSCPILCDMNCSTPGLPVHHQLPEFTQTHVH